MGTPSQIRSRHPEEVKPFLVIQPLNSVKHWQMNHTAASCLAICPCPCGWNSFCSWRCEAVRIFHHLRAEWAWLLRLGRGSCPRHLALQGALLLRRRRRRLVLTCYARAEPCFHVGREQPRGAGARERRLSPSLMSRFPPAPARSRPGPCPGGPRAHTPRCSPRRRSSQRRRSRRAGAGARRDPERPAGGKRRRRRPARGAGAAARRRPQPPRRRRRRHSGGGGSGGCRGAAAGQALPQPAAQRAGRRGGLPPRAAGGGRRGGQRAAGGGGAGLGRLRPAAQLARLVSPGHGARELPELPGGGAETLNRGPHVPPGPRGISPPQAGPALPRRPRTAGA